MYTTGEPCPMCMGAIYWSMIDNVYFANTKEEAALCGFDDSKIYKELALPWQSRALNMAHLPTESAIASFGEWRAKMQGEIDRHLGDL
jgi:tRNA(Arg) A34 adenosine deaminase TadA